MSPVTGKEQQSLYLDYSFTTNKYDVEAVDVIFNATGCWASINFDYQSVQKKGFAVIKRTYI